MIKILLGGSPCTHWSIAKNNRETLPNGVGWELFQNYVIAKEKFKPDFFLYENNKSISAAIKQQIAKELGVSKDPNTRLTHINSALVSAQNRQRFYVTNFGDIKQPEDRNIMLEDILETGGINVSGSEKSYCLTATYHNASLGDTLARKQRNMLATPIIYQRPRWNNSGGKGAKTGLYTIPSERSNRLIEVRDGEVRIGDKIHKIKLEDGFYEIRKLTVTECERLQTMPDGYCKSVSNTRAYMALGNGWTAEVIIHLLNHALSNVPRDEEIVVLSLYDGIATGRYCLDKMGFTNVIYYAYEIDKYTMKIALDNYPDIIECGDAFAVRESGWKL